MWLVKHQQTTAQVGLRRPEEEIDTEWWDWNGQHNVVTKRHPPSPEKNDYITTIPQAL